MQDEEPSSLAHRRHPQRPISLSHSVGHLSHEPWLFYGKAPTHTTSCPVPCRLLCLPLSSVLCGSRLLLEHAFPLEM